MNQPREMKTEDEKKNIQKITNWGYFSIVYGVIFLIYDRIDFFISTLYWSSVLSQAYAEPLLLRFINLIISLSLMVSGYFLIKRRKESWYLFNYAFLCIIYKYIISLLFFPFSSGNLLIKSLFHLAFAIYGLIFINSQLLKEELSINGKNRGLILLYISIIAIGTITFYSYEYMIPYERDNDKKFRSILAQSHVHNPADSCLFYKNFKEILDTLKVMNDYSSIKIIALNELKKPTYSEELSIFERYVLSEKFKYNLNGFLKKSVKESSYREDLENTYLYDYYRDGRLKSKQNIIFRNTIIDTLTHYFEYLYDDKVIQKDSSQRVNFKKYKVYIDSTGKILKRDIYRWSNLNYSEFYTYTSKDLLSKVEIKDLRTNKLIRVERTFYDRKGNIKNQLNYQYKNDSNEIRWKELIIFKNKKSQ